MKIRTSDDVGTNRVTLEKMLKPAIDFIMEHKDERDRGALFKTCIHILKNKTKISPIMNMGILFSSAADINRKSHDRAVFHAMAGLKAVADR